MAAANPWEAGAAAPAPAAGATAPTLGQASGAPPGAPPQGGGATNCLKSQPIGRLNAIMRAANLINAVLLGVAGFFAFSIIDGSVTRFFLACYICLFALLLFAFETRWKKTEGAIRRKFGFMFTYTGRTAFLVFLGAINFGMLADENKGTTGRDWVLSIGIATIANALFNCVILCSHPHFRNTQHHVADPNMLDEAKVQAYLREHPELAAQAAQGFTPEQTQPPPVAADFGSGSAGAAGHRNVSFAAATQQTGGKAPRGGGAYKPPPVPSRPTSRSGDGGGDDNPFSSAGVPGTAPPPVPKRAAPAPAPAPVAAPTPAPAPVEDNPFASDNPFADE